MTRLEELEALDEENSNPTTQGRLAAATGKFSHDNPHWESGVPAAFQPEKAIQWQDAFEAEYEAAAKSRAASTIPVIQQSEAA